MGAELPTGLQERLCISGIEALKPLQEVALDAALRGLDIIVHAQTGSGKTLCFALPMLARLEPATALQGLVLVPTLELAAQTARVFNALQPDSATALSRETEQLPQTPIVVGSPAMLLRFLSGKAPVEGGKQPSPSKELLSALRVVVLDEADALLMPLGRYSTLKEKMRREDHPKEAAVLLETLCAQRGHDLQVLAASATVGRPLRRSLAALCERPLELIRAPEAAGDPAFINSAPSHGTERPAGGMATRAVGLADGVSVEVVTAEDDNVIAALHDVLRSEAAALPLLFIAPGRSLVAELRLLRQCELNAVALDREVILRAVDTSIPLAIAEAATAATATADASMADASTASFAVDATGADAAGQGPSLLVSSPSGARGLDLHGLDLVVIVGVPPTADAFVHLAGRTARQGSHGRVIVLTTAEEADGRLPTIASQLGLDLRSIHRRHVDERNERWASMWAVHEKIIHAEEKKDGAVALRRSSVPASKQRKRRRPSRRG